MRLCKFIFIKEDSFLIDKELFFNPLQSTPDNQCMEKKRKPPVGAASSCSFVKKKLFHKV